MRTKTLVTIVSILLLVLLIILGIGFSLGTVKRQLKDRPDTKTEINDVDVKKVDGFVVEEIPEIVNETNMPSYCKPESYTIVKFPNGEYGFKLPSGTLSSGIYKTPSDANDAIIKYATDSKKRWLDTGGLDF
ncbi:MAG: hypothetical protein L0Y61_09290 [Epsilonproteobacteria bacterium]|nr:hypothetical protein [Campylobacterota bacterium]